MMGGRTPATCWAVIKRQDNKLEDCCIWLVIYFNCTIVHGLTNLKVNLMLKYSQKCQKLRTEKRGYENVMEEWLCKVFDITYVPVLLDLRDSYVPETIPIGWHLINLYKLAYKNQLLFVYLTLEITKHITSLVVHLRGVHRNSNYWRSSTRDR
jgi:hypothetical protein